MERIESADNKKIKLAQSLVKRKKREAAGLFLAEGLRLAEMAAESDWEISYGLVTPAFRGRERGARLLERLVSRTKLYEVEERLLKKAAATETPQGILLVLEERHWALSELPAPENPLYVLLDSLQEPGNVGTILRTADAAGADGVLLTRGSADPFGDKAVRSAMGSLFHLPIGTNLTAEEVLAFTRERGLRLLATALDAAAKLHFDTDFREPSLVVFGNEGNGVSEAILQAAEKVYIPMAEREAGQAESLNVAASAAVLLYEALRQRRYSNRQI